MVKCKVDTLTGLLPDYWIRNPSEEGIMTAKPLLYSRSTTRTSRCLLSGRSCRAFWPPATICSPLPSSLGTGVALLVQRPKGLRHRKPRPIIAKTALLISSNIFTWRVWEIGRVSARAFRAPPSFGEDVFSFRCDRTAQRSTVYGTGDRSICKPKCADQ